MLLPSENPYPACDANDVIQTDCYSTQKH